MNSTRKHSKMVDAVFASLPRSHIVIENGTIHVPSIFMLDGGPDELFSFLGGCMDKNCTAVFDNEEITVLPDRDVRQDVILSLYSLVAFEPKIFNYYNRYLLNIDRMKWSDQADKEESK